MNILNHTTYLNLYGKLVVLNILRLGGEITSEGNKINLSDVVSSILSDIESIAINFTFPTSLKGFNNPNIDLPSLAKVMEEVYNKEKNIAVPSVNNIRIITDEFVNNVKTGTTYEKTNEDEKCLELAFLFLDYIKKDVTKTDQFSSYEKLSSLLGNLEIVETLFSQCNIVYGVITSESENE